MSSRPRFQFVPALLALGFFVYVQPATANDVGAALFAAAENEDAEDADDNDKKESSRSKRLDPVTPDGTSLPRAEQSYSVAMTEPAEATVEHVVVSGFDVNPVEYPALPEVEGTRINSGKKTSFVKPDEFPAVANNNYREVTSTIPGLLISEEPSSPIINIGYRGFDSQRAEFTQVLKDGISIKNEQFGFPETHYTPILDSVERVEFVRGGSALQYGPQPGGALNFITKMPRRDAPFHFETKNAFGDDAFYQNYTAIDGTLGKFGYYVFYDHREREGFRENSQYQVDSGSMKFVYDLSNDSRIIIDGDVYYEEHGEPGGLRRRGDPAGDPVNGVFYEDGRDQISRMFDKFRLSRYFGSLEYQKVFSPGTELDITAFGGYLSRWSRRQRGGGFGTLPIGGAANTDTVQDRQVWSEGVDARVRHDYQFMSDTSTFAGGVYFYHALQKRTDKRGVTAFANDGQLRNLNFGETWNGSIFAENRFHFGRLSIVPGFRVELINTSLDEDINVAKVPPISLAEQSDFAAVPLFGLGLSYVLIEGAATSTGAVADPKDHKDLKGTTPSAIMETGPPRLEAYGNISQGYRPRTYGELVPTSANGIVNSNLEEGHSWEAEIGFRGKPLPYLRFDISGFYIRFDDQISEFPAGGFTITDNVGDARYWGGEASLELDVLALLNGGKESPYGRLNLYGNVTVLDAEFTSGLPEVVGKTPVFAPDYLFKTGAIYRWKETVKVALIGTLVDDHWADAANSFQRFIPSYQVWDLTVEVNFWDGRIGVFAGINNLFDQDFWAEARDEGIVPAYLRNYYGGIKIRF